MLSLLFSFYLEKYIFIKLTNSTESLQHDHVFIKRVKDIVNICYAKLYENKNIPIEDIEIISVIIEEFIDKFHHNKEENAYFPEVENRDRNYSNSVYKLTVEHEFGRRVAMMLRRELYKYKNKEINTIEPIARFLRTYSIFIEDHFQKEEQFFDLIEKNNSISNEQDQKILEHYQICKNNVGGPERLNQIIKLVEYLENRDWFR